MRECDCVKNETAPNCVPVHSSAITGGTFCYSLPLTEDVCFLCKEGGDLVECDEGSRWARRVRDKHASMGNPPPPPGSAYSCCGVPEDEEGERNLVATGEFTRCKKVYHAYCMGFEIGDAELGSCPRHACQECGEWAKHYCR